MDLANISTQLVIATSVGVAFVVWWWWIPRKAAVAALRNIPGPANDSFWTGNLGRFYHPHGFDFHKEVAFNYGPVVKIHGLVGTPFLYVSDPKALHTVLIKEEAIFEETPAFLANTFVIFGPGLLSSMGHAHRKQRKLLNPVFSINHMRHMLPIFYNVVHKLRDAMSTQITNGVTELDMLNWMGRTALELIGQGGLGYSFDPLTEDKENAYGNALKSLTPVGQRTAVLRLFVPYVYQLRPAWLLRWLTERFPRKAVREMKVIVDTMCESSTEIYQAKKAALEKGDEGVTRQVGEGKDIMSILMRANAASAESDKLPEDEVIAQMSTFVFAATDTTSNTLARILQALAENTQYQDKLREEILAADAGNQMSYDALDSLPLLDAVCRETLRLYPPVILLSRVANKDTVLPLAEPITGVDGSLITEIPIPKGMEVHIGTLGANASKSRWGEDAWEWKPERWLAPLPKSVTENSNPGVYSNLMTFMGGRRACIGFKFSEMEMKVVLAVLLSKFAFELTEKPIEWNMAGVRYPTIGRNSDVAQMPLKVTLLKG